MGFLPTMIYEKSLYDVIENVFFWEEIVIFLHNLEGRKRKERKLISTLLLCPELWCCTWSFWLVCRDRHMRRGSFFFFRPSSISMIIVDSLSRLEAKNAMVSMVQRVKMAKEILVRVRGRKNKTECAILNRKGANVNGSLRGNKRDSYLANKGGGNDDDETQLIFRYVLKENCDWQETNFGNKLSKNWIFFSWNTV